ncbi:Uncharacterised protein [Mycobacteroides abscessus subsp. abscessus]|nr:Uncharacterised protein [Mycobacteroides abscessus subsp. abscessus]
MREDVRERMVIACGDDLELMPIASRELERRLKRTGLALPPRTRSRCDKLPYGRAVPVLKREASPVEMLIVRAIARTWGAAQFGCSPDGAVFTADTDGWSMPSGRRDEVTRLSPLLVEVADIFNSWRRNGAGGRFYERDGCFFDAEDGAIFVEIQLTSDQHIDFRGPFDQAERDRAKADSSAVGEKSLWQRIIGWISG